MWPEIISFLGHANVPAFHESPDRLYTEHTFIKPKAHGMLYVLSTAEIFEAS